MIGSAVGMSVQQGIRRSLQQAAGTTMRRRLRPTSSLKRFSSSHNEAGAAAATVAHDPAAIATPPPTKQQIRAFFVSQAVPFVGFGLMDQTVMLQAGHAIDLSIGVTFGLSTLTAAALGQVCSDAAGVLFGGSLDNIAKAAGLPRSGMTAAQRGLPLVRRVKIAGNLVGVVTGCLLGLLNLFFMDTDRPSTLKFQHAITGDEEFSFAVEASNAVRDDATVFTVRGPDIDGVLASMTSALAATNCSLVELNAHRGKEDSRTKRSASKRNHRHQLHTIEDVFAVVQSGTNEKIPDDELDDVAMILLEATNTPVNIHTFKAQVKELEERNTALQMRMRKLEKEIHERQIKVRKRTTRRSD